MLFFLAANLAVSEVDIAETGLLFKELAQNAKALSVIEKGRIRGKPDVSQGSEVAAPVERLENLERHSTVKPGASESNES